MEGKKTVWTRTESASETFMATLTQGLGKRNQKRLLALSFNLWYHKCIITHQLEKCFQERMCVACATL